MDLEEQPKKKHPYKIEIGDEVIIYRNEMNGKTFYNVQVSKKNYDGTKEKFYKNVKFKNGVDILNGTKIRIIDMFEDVRSNPKDKYTPIWSLFILDYETIADEKKEQEEALNNFQNHLNDKEDDPFEEQVFIDDNFLD